MPKNKVIIIGIDGGTWDLIKPWANDGSLPNLKKLMDGGCTGNLKSTIPPLTMPATPSFITGKNPGKHGMYYFTKRKPGSYSYRLMSAKDRPVETLWNMVDRQGGKSGSYLLPFTYPADKIKGFIVPGDLGSPPLEKAIYPENLRNELLEEVQGYKTFEMLRKKELGMEYIENLDKIIEISSEIIIYLLKKYDPDLSIIWFDEVEKAQHLTWKYLDPRFKEYGSIGAGKYRQSIKDAYIKTDTAIGEILKNTKENTQIIVMSDHGFATVYKSNKYSTLNNWLKEKNLLCLKDFSDNLRISSYDKIYSVVTKFHLNALISRYFPRRIINKFQKMSSSYEIDWSKTKAYVLGNEKYIYINKKGREPEGIVEPGKDYETVRDFIISELYKIKDPEGNKVIDKVYKKEEVFKGDYFEEAPDIILIPAKLSPSAHEIRKESVPVNPWVTEWHDLNGILILNGDIFKKNVSIENAEIIDIAPTVLYTLGIPIPKDMDGKVLQSSITENFVKNNPVNYQESKKEKTKEKSSEISEKEEKEIIDRLKALGYLE